MSFGGETVYVVTVTENPAVRDRYNNPQEVRTETPIPGCRFRPLTSKERNDLTTSKERTELGEKVADPWKLTAPPVDAIMNAKNLDEIKFDGITYQILGRPRVFSDFSGQPFKVTAVCERHLG